MSIGSAALKFEISSEINAPSDLGARAALRLSGIVLFATLILQRFAMPFASKPISLVGPICLLIAGIGLLRGVLAIDRRRAIAFFILCGWIAAGIVWQATHPSPFGVATDKSSLAQFLVLTSFAMLTFGQRVDERAFFRQVNWWFALIAAAGIAQFAAQFIGIRIFRFGGLLPASMLYETWYNLVIPVGVGGLIKSNGFFLIEPSVFSQVMALGLIVELLAARRPWYLVLFATGLMVSFSGTGWFVLLSFVVAATLSQGGRGVLLAAFTLAVLGFTIGITFLLAPHVADAFSQRLQEFSEIGTSAHMRFVTPFWLTSDVLSRDWLAAIFGIGSGASEAIYLPYQYNVNTPIKVALEYGLPALIAYLALFLVNERTPAQRALVFPALMMFLFAGGYQQFPPVLFLILLLLCVARLRPATQ